MQERPPAVVEEDRSAKRRAGRPRSAEIDRAILDAAQELLVEQGYGGMTMEGIAARAGVGKATVYRRWSTKADLLVDSLRGHEGLRVPMPDTGDVRADVEAMLVAIARAMAGEDGTVLAAFAAEKLRHPELRVAFEKVFVTERRRHLRHLIAKAVDLGELSAGTDIDLVADIGPALCLQRLFMHNGAPERDLPGRIVAQIFDRSARPPGR